MCTASSKYSGSLIKSLILDWKVHPFAKSWISTVFISLKSLHTFVLHLNLATGTHLRHTPVCTSQVKLEEFQERNGWTGKQQQPHKSEPRMETLPLLMCSSQRSRDQQGGGGWKSHCGVQRNSFMYPAFSGSGKPHCCAGWQTWSKSVHSPAFYGHELCVAKMDPDFWIFRLQLPVITRQIQSWWGKSIPTFSCIQNRECTFQWPQAVAYYSLQIENNARETYLAL